MCSVLCFVPFPLSCLWKEVSSVCLENGKKAPTTQQAQSFHYRAFTLPLFTPEVIQQRNQITTSTKHTVPPDLCEGNSTRPRNSPSLSNLRLKNNNNMDVGRRTPPPSTTPIPNSIRGSCGRSVSLPLTLKCIYTTSLHTTFPV
jgi:hypothetical protein